MESLQNTFQYWGTLIALYSSLNTDMTPQWQIHWSIQDHGTFMNYITITKASFQFNNGSWNAFFEGAAEGGLIFGIQ